VSNFHAPHIALGITSKKDIAEKQWCTKQWQNVAQVLRNDKIKFPKDFFRYCSVHQHGRRGVT